MKKSKFTEAQIVFALQQAESGVTAPKFVAIWASVKRRFTRGRRSTAGSDQIVYVPRGFLQPEGVRSLMYEGKTVENMVDWLYENCGQPAQSFEAISPEDLENFYYIDRTFHSNPGG